MWDKRFGIRRMTTYVITWCLVIGLFCIPATSASQQCFKCCGSGVWHVDNKMPCSGKGCNYCVKVMVVVDQGKYLIRQYDVKHARDWVKFTKKAKRCVRVQVVIIVLHARHVIQRVGYEARSP